MRRKYKLETGKLIIWEPLKENPFDRFKVQMNLVSLQYDGEDFVLIFTAFNSEEKFKFIYKQNDFSFYAIRHFRILKEWTRGDIEFLIGKLREERDSAGLQKFPYDPTFYKIENSSFKSWYKNIDLSLPTSEDSQLEHHLYIASDYFIDVLSENQPIISMDHTNR